MHSHRKSCDYDAPGYKNDVRNGLAFYVRVSDAGVPAKEAPHVWFHRFELTGEERNGGCQERETEGLIFLSKLPGGMFFFACQCFSCTTRSDTDTSLMLYYVQLESQVQLRY